ncbi:DMT family transporter [Fulvivirga sp. M361]|nr:DMT family transporter [Fulvivirga sp. M361]
MIGTLASFCIMAIGARELNGVLDTFQLLFYRSALGLVIMSSIHVLSGNPHPFRTQYFKQHMIRNTFHFAGQYGWFIGIGLLPLAEVFALEFTTPVWTALIAYFLLKEQMTKVKVFAIVVGLLGVLIILKPGYTLLNGSSFIVLAAAVAFAIAHIFTKSLSYKESPATILFYMSLIQLPLGLIPALFNWQWVTGETWPWIVLIAITGLTAHFCTAKAMQYADVTLVVTLDFLRLPLITLAGIILYNEDFDITLLIGSLLMLTGNLLNIKKSMKHRTT